MTEEKQEETTTTEQAPVENQPEIHAEEEGQAQAPQKKTAEYNWAEARKKRDELERKLEAMQSKIEELSKPKAQEEDDDIGIKDEDIAEGKHLKQLKKEIKELRSYIKQKEASTVDERLSLKHPDFGSVVSRENVERLKELEPEIALSLSHIKDPFQQGIAAYKMMKRLGIAQDPVELADKQKAEINSKKPVSVNAVSKNSALGNAHLFENGLTKELKSQLWKEMQDSMKRG